MLMNQADISFLLVDVQEKLIGAIHEGQQVVDRCAWLLKFAEALSIPCLISEQYPKGLGHTVASLNSFKERAADLEKTAFSCVSDKACQKIIENTLTQQVLIMGIEAHVCVLQTALELKERGYQVFVATDAIGSRHLHDYQATLIRFQQNQIQLVSSEMVFFECVKDASHPHFKQLSQTFLQNK